MPGFVSQHRVNERGSSEETALNGFQSVDLTLDWAVAPFFGDSGLNWHTKFRIDANPVT